MQQQESRFADRRVLGLIVAGTVRVPGLAGIVAGPHDEGLGDPRIIWMGIGVGEHPLADERNGVGELLETLVFGGCLCFLLR